MTERVNNSSSTSGFALKPRLLSILLLVKQCLGLRVCWVHRPRLIRPPILTRGESSGFPHVCCQDGDQGTACLLHSVGPPAGTRRASEVVCLLLEATNDIHIFLDNSTTSPGGRWICFACCGNWPDEKWSHLKIHPTGRMHSKWKTWFFSVSFSDCWLNVLHWLHAAGINLVEVSALPAERGFLTAWKRNLLEVFNRYLPEVFNRNFLEVWNQTVPGVIPQGHLFSVLAFISINKESPQSVEGAPSHRRAWVLRLGSQPGGQSPSWAGDWPGSAWEWSILSSSPAAVMLSAVATPHTNKTGTAGPCPDTVTNQRRVTS